MMAEKWNCTTHEYEPYELPEGSSLLEPQNAVIVCAHCGKELEFQNTYSSLEIHNELGLGYAVCFDCHFGEVERRLLAEEEEKDDEI